MDHAKIRNIIEDTLHAMGIAFDVVEFVSAPEAKHARFMVRSVESALLIGAKGEHLSALNAVVRRIASKALPVGADARFLVDVNEYHEKGLEAVRAKATVLSERARSLRADIEMEPMSSYERMLIHSYLEGAADIKTESKGEGASRRVVIKYVGEAHH